MTTSMLNRSLHGLLSLGGATDCRHVSTAAFWGFKPSLREHSLELSALLIWMAWSRPFLPYCVAGPLLTISGTKIRSAAPSTCPPRLDCSPLGIGAFPLLLQSYGTACRAKSGKPLAWVPSRKPSRSTYLDSLIATS